MRGAAWLPSISTLAPAACAMRTMLSTGTTAPVTLATCVTATSLVRGEMSAVKVAMSRPPVIDRHHPQVDADAVAQELPRHDVGVMLHHRDENLVTRLQERVAPAVGDEV